MRFGAGPDRDLGYYTDRFFHHDDDAADEADVVGSHPVIVTGFQ